MTVETMSQNLRIGELSLQILTRVVLRSSLTNTRTR